MMAGMEGMAAGMAAYEVRMAARMDQLGARLSARASESTSSSGHQPTGTLLNFSVYANFFYSWPASLLAEEGLHQSRRKPAKKKGKAKDLR